MWPFSGFIVIFSETTKKPQPLFYKGWGVGGISEKFKIKFDPV